MTAAERNAIVEQYLPLAWKFAGKMHQRAVGRRYGTVEELYHEAVIGLCLAVEKYDPQSVRNNGASLFTFVYAWTWGYLRATVHRNNGLIKVPATYFDGSAVKRIREGNTGYAKDMEEIARCVRVRQFPEHDPRRGERPFDVRDTRRVGLDPMEAAEVRGWLGLLHDRERHIIAGLYGIGRRASSAREVGEELGLSAQRVLQIEEMALRRMLKLVRRGVA